MLLVLSPAKTLDFASPAASVEPTTPRWMKESARLIRGLRRLDAEAIADLMDLSPRLAELNVERYRAWKPKNYEAQSRPAIFAFDGDVYEGLRARDMDREALQWAQGHLRIFSGLYGVLRPFDWLQPYRLEMATRFENDRGRDLYAFWGDRIARSLDEDLKGHHTALVVNLASEEYFAAVDRRRLRAPVVQAVFQESRGGPFKVVSFSAKKARGLMARWAIERRVEDPEQLKDFAEEGYRFSVEASETQVWVFRRLVGEPDADRHPDRYPDRNLDRNPDPNSD
jgi:cytoplasmic iron level regulating protein YaaA (DUF328/UPF0246 family)